MKRYYLSVAFFAAFILSLQQYVWAQRKPVTGKQAAITANTPYKLFFEKIYLHTDREYYASGDDLWFKAYLVNATSNHPTYTSNNLYIDLVSPDSKIMAREILRLDSGMGIGDFKLTDSIPGGTYHLRAYTNWMRNFGDNFIFDKKIYINNILGVKITPAATSAGNAGKNKPQAMGVVANSNRINFFPEGGSMVTGVQSIVGFKAEDALGHGVKVQGSVVSSQGDTVSRFESTAAGLGSFAILPVNGAQYKIVGMYGNGKPFSNTLSAPLAEGYCMHVKNTDTSSIQVIVSTNQAMLNKHTGKELKLVAKHADKIYFSGKFMLNDLQTFVSIPKAQASPGVSSILLYDELLHPYSERLVYINGSNGIKINAVPDKSTYAPKEKATISIQLTDAQNKPVKANLSMAVIDGSAVPADEGNIVSYLMLQSEVRGNIDNAAQYFDPGNANRFKQLDLLLLTQGWRDFVWKRLADSALKLSYLPESGFTVSGRLRSVLINKAIPNMNVTLFAPGAKGSKLFGVRTDINGKYYLDGIQLYGNQTLKLSSTDDKGNKSGWIFLDSVGSNVMPVPQLPLIIEEPAPQLALFNTTSTTRMKEARKYKLSDVIALKEVNVREKPRTLTLRNQTVQSFGYPEYDFDINAKDNAWKNLEDFIIHKVPGAQTNTGNFFKSLNTNKNRIAEQNLNVVDGSGSQPNRDSSEGVVFHFNGQTIFPTFIVDKQEDVFERLDYYNLTMDQINSVRVNHMVSMGGGDVVIISLSLKPSAFEKKQFNIINSDVNGYYNARIFYAPNHNNPSNKTDQRLTLHWEPMIKTDANGQAKVSYYNADPKSKIRVVLQGLTETGVPVTTTANYLVK